MVLRFAGFELDRQRAELRGTAGEVLKLRPKALAMLDLLAMNAGRVLSKQELMDAVWPNVHVGDDSLFQCIKEIRTALGDDQRQLIKLVSGRGYLFEAEVSVESADVPTPAAARPDPIQPDQHPVPLAPPPVARRFSRPVIAILAAFGLLVIGLAITTMLVTPEPVATEDRPITVAVMPIAAADDDAASTAADVTTRLSDGLAKIDDIRVIAHQVAAQDSREAQPNFVVSGELQKREGSWEVRARMTRTANGEVVWTAPVSVALNDSDLSLQQSRLAAGIGHPLALHINTLLKSNTRPTTIDAGSAGRAKVAIEQATASIRQTTRERFATAHVMLEKALAADPDNVDLTVALAALQLRGIQMVWYSPEESAAAERSARTVLEQALRTNPRSIPVLEAYCRFLNTTNEFVESLVACARVLNFDPWNGLALYHIGLAQMQLGRFDDALATFQQADRFDTPQVSRWTWRLGIGMIYLLKGRSGEAVPWLESSIAITPASGRSYMLLSAAYQGLGRSTEAKAAMDKALILRPGSNYDNVALPTKNASSAYLAAIVEIRRALVAAGLPEH